MELFYRNINKNKTLIADFGLLYAAAIWGSTFFLVKDVINFIDPFFLCAYRFLLAALMLLPFLIFTKRKVSLYLKEGIILGVFLWFIYISQTIGLIYTTASNAAFITGLFVVFIPFLLFILFKKVPSLNNILAVLIALIGLWSLTGGLTDINKGDKITLITAFSYALHVLYSDKFIKKGCDPYVLCFQQFLVVALLSFSFGFMFKLPYSVNKISVIMVIVFLTIFPTLSAFLIQLLAQKITSPVKVSLIFALEPVFGALFAWTLGNEAFILSHALGGALIVIALIVNEINIKNILRFYYKAT